MEKDMKKMVSKLIKVLKEYCKIIFFYWTKEGNDYIKHRYDNGYYILQFLNTNNCVWE